MSGQRYPKEFKIEAVKQVTDRGHSVADVKDSSHQSNSYTKILICMRTLNETVKAYIYHKREKPCF
jgi:hypothetical protein